MNHAYVDGSFAEIDGPIEGQMGAAARGGYGVVLLRPGQPPAHLHGLLEDVPDCNITELRAVLAAVAHAPAGPLMVHTDNTNILSVLRRGSGHFLQTSEALNIHQLAAERGVTLHLARAERTRRHMQRAHQLANAARLERPLPITGPYAQSNLRFEPWQSQVEVTLRRPGERVSAQLLPSDSPLPRSVQALLLATRLTQNAETLLTYQASKLAAALWRDPRRALPGPAQDELKAARQEADARGVEVLFERVDAR